jgi:hypothetical protein
VVKRRVFKALNGSKSYRKWKEWSEGDYIIGKFVDEEADNYRKPSYVLEVEEVEFEDKEAEEKCGPGKRVALNSTGLLDKIMSKKVQIGDVIMVEYGGKDVMTKGPFEGDPVHIINVSVVEEEEDSSDDGLSDDDTDL